VPVILSAGTPARDLALRRVFLEDRIQRCDEQVCICLREYQWRAQLDYVVVRTIRSGQDAAITQAIYGIRRLLGRGLAGFAVLN
jgi:hypothetical protein